MHIYTQISTNAVTTLEDVIISVTTLKEAFSVTVTKDSVSHMTT